MSCVFNRLILLPSFDEELAVHLLDRLGEMEISKGAHLSNAGDTCSCLCFVEIGELMGYIPAKNGKNVSRFMLDGDVCTVPQSFFLQQPSRETIIARKDSLLSYLTYPDFVYLQHTFPMFNYFIVDLLLSLYLELEAYAAILRSERMEVRYKWLTEAYPAIAGSVDGKYLSSYLGMTPVALSRIITKDKPTSV